MGVADVLRTPPLLPRGFPASVSWATVHSQPARPWRHTAFRCPWVVAGTPSPHTFIFSVENAVCKDSYNESMSAQYDSQVTPDIGVCKNPYRQRFSKRK